MQSSTLPLDSLLTLLLEAELRFAAAYAQNPDALYTLLHHTAARLVPVDSCYICLSFQNEQVLHFVYTFDGNVFNDPVSMPMGDGPTSTVMRSKKAFVLSATTEPVQAAGTSFGDIHKVSRSALHVPMRVAMSGEERIVGVFSVQSYEQDAYTHNATALIQWLANS